MEWDGVGGMGRKWGRGRVVQACEGGEFCGSDAH